MDIVFHLGAHCTDDGKLMRSLLRSRGAFADGRVEIPGPRSYRVLLRETIGILHGATASAEVQSLLLDGMTETDDAERVILFHENLICLPPKVLSPAGLYPMAPDRIAAMRGLFPDHHCRFQIAMLHPALMIWGLLARNVAADYTALMAGIAPKILRWRPLVEAILEKNPDIDLTLWCHEDAAVLWPEILRDLVGLPDTMPLEGDADMALTLLTDTGTEALARSFRETPPRDGVERTERLTDALARNANPALVEQALDYPGWTEAAVTKMTRTYEADCAALAARGDVRFLTAPVAVPA